MGIYSGIWERTDLIRIREVASPIRMWACTGSITAGYWNVPNKLGC